MFKAKLIEDGKYCNVRSKQSVLFPLVSVIIGLLMNFYNFSIWITILMLGVYILGFVFLNKNERLMSLLMGSNLIEVDDVEIRIKSKKGISQEVIKMDLVEKIILKKNDGVAQEGLLGMINEFKGKPEVNYLIVKQENKERRFEFEIDSHYMIIQLNKIVKNWINKGYHIEDK